MTRDQARQILLLHRPWSHDPPEADMAAALELAREDPELKAWFAQHCALQLAVRESLRAQTTPEAFREQIVAECRARIRARSRHRLLAAATALVVLAVGAEAYYLFGPRFNREEISLASYQQRMGREALRLYRMDLETDDLQQIRTYLASRQSPTNYVLPVALAGTRATGCLATQWQGRPVSMICFHTGQPLPPGQSSDLFLFVIAQSALPDAPESATPTIAQVNRLTVARWAGEGNVYLLATEMGEAELRKRL
jgi:hypothetical protein